MCVTKILLTVNYLCGVSGSSSSDGTEKLEMNLKQVTEAPCVCAAGSIPDAPRERDGRGWRGDRHEPVPAGPCHHSGPVPGKHQTDAVRGEGPPGTAHLPSDAAPVYDPGITAVRSSTQPQTLQMVVF